jgi:hypothetical protein
MDCVFQKPGRASCHDRRFEPTWAGSAGNQTTLLNQIVPQSPIDSLNDWPLSVPGKGGYDDQPFCPSDHGAF